MLTDRIRYGEPKQDLKFVDKPTPHFDAGWKRITLAAPLPNTSSETRGELREIRRQAKSVTPEQRAIIELQDRDDLEMEFVGLLRRMGQPVHKPLIEEIKAIAEELTTIGLYFKDRFDRARPAQLFRAMGLEPFPEGETTGTASYPSNHALIGTFLGEWLAGKFPAKATALRRLGKQMGDLRVAGGWHFPSDVEAGRKLAQKLTSFFEEQT